MSFCSIILILIVTLSFFTAEAKHPPVIEPNFVVNTDEVNGSGPNTVPDDGSYRTIVQQTITQDVDLRRSNMIAKGELVAGALQQVRRCDLSPSEGWYIQADGPDASTPSSWECANSTISVIYEGPQYCQYRSFWTLPKLTEYAGVEKINGQNCDKWIYRMDDGSKNVYAFWALQDQAVPMAAGRIENPQSPTSLYTIFFSNFKAGSQPESAYYPEEGVVCPAGTDPSILKETAMQLPASLMDMLQQADRRAARS